MAPDTQLLKAKYEKEISELKSSNKALTLALKCSCDTVQRYEKIIADLENELCQMKNEDVSRANSLEEFIQMLPGSLENIMNQVMAVVKKTIALQNIVNNTTDKGTLLSATHSLHMNGVLLPKKQKQKMTGHQPPLLTAEDETDDEMSEGNDLPSMASEVNNNQQSEMISESLLDSSTSSRKRKLGEKNRKIDSKTLKKLGLSLMENHSNSPHYEVSNSSSKRMKGKQIVSEEEDYPSPSHTEVSKLFIRKNKKQPTISDVEEDHHPDRSEESTTFSCRRIKKPQLYDPSPVYGENSNHSNKKNRKSVSIEEEDSNQSHIEVGGRRNKKEVEKYSSAVHFRQSPSTSKRMKKNKLSSSSVVENHSRSSHIDDSNLNKKRNKKQTIFSTVEEEDTSSLHNEDTNSSSKKYIEESLSQSNSRIKKRFPFSASTIDKDSNEESYFGNRRIKKKQQDVLPSEKEPSSDIDDLINAKTKKKQLRVSSMEEDSSPSQNKESESDQLLCDNIVEKGNVTLNDPLFLIPPSTSKGSSSKPKSSTPVNRRMKKKKRGLTGKHRKNNKTTYVLDIKQEMGGSDAERTSKKHRGRKQKNNNYLFPPEIVNISSEDESDDDGDDDTKEASHNIKVKKCCVVLHDIMKNHNISDYANYSSIVDADCANLPVSNVDRSSSPAADRANSPVTGSSSPIADRTSSPTANADSLPFSDISPVDSPTTAADSAKSGELLQFLNVENTIKENTCESNSVPATPIVPEIDSAIKDLIPAENGTSTSFTDTTVATKPAYISDKILSLDAENYSSDAYCDTSFFKLLDEVAVSMSIPERA